MIDENVDRAISGLRHKIINEVVAAFGFSKNGWARKLLTPLFWLPAHHFAYRLAQLDEVAGKESLPAAAKVMLASFIEEVQVKGNDLLPLNGPLLIASNHPGAYDVFALVSKLTRQDIKVIVSDVPLIQSLPAVHNHMIYTPAGIGPRMTAVRKLIRHLQDGGTGVIFPSGKVDPDPEISKEGEFKLQTWSASLELILKKVPETRLSIAIVSGVIAPQFLTSPLLKMIGEPWRQQKLAEIIQVMQQLIFKKKFGLIPKITFGLPSTGQNLKKKYPQGELNEAIFQEARSVYHQHVNNHLMGSR